MLLHVETPVHPRAVSRAIFGKQASGSTKTDINVNNKVVPRPKCSHARTSDCATCFARNVTVAILTWVHIRSKTSFLEDVPCKTQMARLWHDLPPRPEIEDVSSETLDGTTYRHMARLTAMRHPSKMMPS